MDTPTFTYLAALPEIFILCMACLILIVDVTVSEQHRIVTYLLVQVTIFGAFALTLTQFGDYPQAIVTFGGQYVVDKLAVLTKLFIYVFHCLPLRMREYIEVRDIARSEYYLLGLFAVLGMSIMVSGYSFLDLSGLELLSLSLYAMVAIHKQSI